MSDVLIWLYALATVVLNSGVQAGAVQSKSVLDSHYRRREGTEEGEMSDSGNFIRKECSQSLDRSSARTMWVPGRWTAASFKTPQQKEDTIACRCISAIEDCYIPPLHYHIGLITRHRCPQITAVMGNSSLAKKLLPMTIPCHPGPLQLVVCHAPQPQEPDTSEVRWREYCSGIAMTAAPFQWAANAFHHFI